MQLPWPRSSGNTPRRQQGRLAAGAIRDSQKWQLYIFKRNMAGFLSEVCFPGETTTI